MEVGTTIATVEEKQPGSLDANKDGGHKPAQNPDAKARDAKPVGVCLCGLMLMWCFRRGWVLG